MGRRCNKNKLLMRWCKTEKDIKFWFPKSCDGHLLNSHFCNLRPKYSLNTLNFNYVKSFVDELKDRGYDIKTIRFEITLEEKKIDKTIKK